MHGKWKEWRGEERGGEGEGGERIGGRGDGRAGEGRDLNQADTCICGKGSTAGKFGNGNYCSTHFKRTVGIHLVTAFPQFKT